MKNNTVIKTLYYALTVFLGTFAFCALHNYLFANPPFGVTYVILMMVTGGWWWWSSLYFNFEDEDNSDK